MECSGIVEHSEKIIKANRLDHSEFLISNHDSDLNSDTFLFTYCRVRFMLMLSKNQIPHDNHKRLLFGLLYEMSLTSLH